MTRLNTLILLTLAATAACGQGRNDATSEPAKPTDLGDAIRQARHNAKGERPAQTGQVAVLDLEISAGAAAAPAPGATAAQPARPQVTARVARARVVAGAAPKLFARNSGDWEVRLKGRTPMSYRIPNPLADIEIENPKGSRSPFSQVVPTGPVPVQIVVPLTRDGRSLGVESIEIVDTVTGQTILSAPLAGAAAPPG
jgi:hypothetical protein